MGNTLEIHDGDFHLRIYIDRLLDFPIPNFRRLLRLLRDYPEEMERLGGHLRELQEACKLEWAARSEAFVDGWKEVNPRSRAVTAKKIRAKNKALRRDLLQAKKRYEACEKRLQIYELQGGNYYA